MTWVFYSILTALLYAVASVFDKLVLSRWIRDPFLPVVVLATVGCVAGVGVYCSIGFDSLDLVHILLCLLAGSFNVLTSLFYLHAVKVEEVSRVVPLFRLAPFFVAVCAALFLDAVLTLVQYGGMCLLVFGAIVISTREGQKIAEGKALRFMLLAAFCIGINATLVKYVLGFAGYWTVFSYLRIGGFLSILPFVWIQLPRLRGAATEVGNGIQALIILGATLPLLANLSLTIARAYGDVTLVAAMVSTQSFFVLAIMFAISKWFPRVLSEDIRSGTVMRKVVAIVLMTIGALLVT